ncbi:sensor histidine kinase [Kribbella italica]|uniref:Oxygen sensor histidine kinase NreB n=1 Tax=Kribbella italica TaxID=1540520 RepID=A0A7W9J1Q9_9ACTN|nr:sensor histidine kinase [Kribbella italica]MBB5833750.1 signal transduction histidine kinase [Kribbella italica]
MKLNRAPDSEAMWARTMLAWHIVFWSLLAVTTLVSVLPNDLTGREHVILLALLATLGTAYALIGGPAMLSRQRVPAHIYRVIAIVCVAGVVAIFPQSIFLMFIASPQIWLLADRIREGALFSVLLVVCVGTGQLYGAGGTMSAFWNILPWMIISLVVSLLLGIWIDRVIAQSEQRAELIAELEAARDELANAHHTAGVMAERERMAREIHDTLAQGMTSIVMLAQTAAVELSRGGAAGGGAAGGGAAGGGASGGGASAVANRLSAIEDTARENLAEARALVAAFTPVALSEATLTEVLRRQAERFAAETGVDVQVSLDMPDEEVAALPQGQQVVLLRAAQEALANVRKHAGATTVLITLTMAADGVGISVSDDGTGFEPSAAAAGYGLAAMRGRVEESGGSVQVESAPGRGTRVQVLIPSTNQENS